MMTTMTLARRNYDSCVSVAVIFIICQSLRIMLKFGNDK